MGAKPRVHGSVKQQTKGVDEMTEQEYWEEYDAIKRMIRNGGRKGK